MLETEFARETAFFPFRFKNRDEADKVVATIQSLIDSPLGAAFRHGHLEARIIPSPVEWEPLLYFSKGAQAAARLAGMRLPSSEPPVRMSDTTQRSLLSLAVPSEKGAGGTGTEDPLKVLIVEDHLDTATMLAHLLEAWGFQSSIARSGAEALHVAEEFHPRIVLLDLGLPDQHGYRLAREMREHADWGKLAFVVVTGWAAPVDQSLSLNAGISHHLVKPVNPDALKSILDRYH